MAQTMKRRPRGDRSRPEPGQRNRAASQRDEPEHRGGAAVDLREQPHHGGGMVGNGIGAGEDLARAPQVEHQLATPRRSVRIVPRRFARAQALLAHD